MTDIVVTEFIDEAALAPLAAYRVLYDADLHRRPAEIARAAAQARALIVRNQTQVTRGLLAACPRLQVVGRLGVGLDNIDLAACAERGVPVRSAEGSNEVSVAEHAFAALLTLYKPSLRDTPAVLAGRWPRRATGSNEVAERTLGIIGLGRIGRRLASRAQAFDMTVVAYDPYLSREAFARAGVEPLALDELLARSDVVSVHCPLNESSRGLLDARALNRLKQGAVLLNTARGHIVDEAELVRLLRSGHLRGALLDVFAQEPVGAGSIFDGVPNLLLTSHVAGLTEDAFSRASHYVVDRVLQVLRD